MKLFRSRKDKMLSGVFGGLSEILKVDVTILRLSYAVLTLFSGFFPFIILYILAAIIIPLESENQNPKQD